MADKKRFKLTFRTITVPRGLGTQRALIIAVGPTPVKGWLQAVLALEDGNMMQKAISVPEFELSAKNETVMIEAPDEQAPVVLYEVQPANNGG